MKHMLAALLVLIVTGTVGLTGEDIRGKETNLPLPRFVSIKTAKANVRRGPSLTYQIDWVYQRKGLPVIVTAEHGHWRRVVDRDGLGGWVHYVLLSGVRTVLVENGNAAMRSQPETDAYQVAILEQGIVARLDECTSEWCWVETNGYEGWVRKGHLWGVKLENAMG